MGVFHAYVPSPGQVDAVTRAAALGVPLGNASLASDPRYDALISIVPCVICDHENDQIVIIDEPTTFNAVWAAHDNLVSQMEPGRRITSLATVVAGIQVSAGGGPHASTHATGGTDLLTTANIGAAPVGHNHDPAYAAIGHSHASSGATGGVIRKTGAQTMTLTAQTAITDASFAVEASSKYYFIMYIAVTTSSGTAPTTAYGLTGPAGATVAITLEQDTSTSVEQSGVLTAFGNFAAGAQVANTGAEVRGVVETGATAGTVQLTAARAGTTPSMVIPVGGVVGFWMKLA